MRSIRSLSHGFPFLAAGMKRKKGRELDNATRVLATIFLVSVSVLMFFNASSHYFDW
ncbi:hypothetical protein EKD16_23625 [Streptomonospora litoralis]|uniref:Uncharacterized protein n=1 Tax=Streptomonospora litoralis TaxID=2498135 RepID=A0A4V0ZKC2_9ACTN|nr:hypothetical protein EKD16_23625 [Streptomonospora litoralis]